MYQGAYDENLLVENFLSEGSADLMHHLNFFKKNLSNRNPEQQAKFSNLFFEKVSLSAIKQEENQLPANIDSKQEGKKESPPDWAKKLYRKIVMITPPDKTESIGIKEIRSKLNKQYLIVTESIKSGNYSNIAMVANQLDLSVADEVIDNCVEPSLAALKKKIIVDKSHIGYQWYFVSEDEKKDTLRKYLENLGFVFSNEDLEEVIMMGRKNPRRKPGTKPVNTRRMRLK